jgi:hypothetical protein
MAFQKTAERMGSGYELKHVGFETSCIELHEGQLSDFTGMLLYIMMNNNTSAASAANASST